MADVLITPNMNLPNPVPTVAPGPDWAEDVSACFDAVDSHNHGSGQGVPINPDGMNINTDLPMNDNNLNTARSVNFMVQASPIALATDIGCLYVSGKDLYYNDEDGNQVRITTGGNVNAGAGSITGLPSGTASASFSGSTFTWRSATNTPANMSVGPLIIGANSAGSKTVTLSPNVAQPANYSGNFPLALPASTSILNWDSAGQQGLVAPDNSSFGISGGTYQVLDGGVTNTKLAAANYGRSSPASYNTTSASFTSTGASVTITGVGRPVLVIVTSNESANSLIMDNSGTSALGSFQIQRNGSGIQKVDFILSGTGGWIPCWTLIDSAPSSGSLTYALYAAIGSGGHMVLTNFELFVMEL